MKNETCAIASTISLNLNRTVWLFILLSNTGLSIRGDTRYFYPPKMVFGTS